MTETPPPAKAPEQAAPPPQSAPSAPARSAQSVPAKAPALNLAQLRAQQNFPLAAAAGAGAALAGAGLWAAATVSTNTKLGLMSVAVGFMVGYAVKNCGKGIDQKFGYLAASLALLGSFFGDVLSTLAFQALRHKQPLLDYLTHQDLSAAINAYSRSFQPMDLLFYAIAVYQAYVLSFKYKLRKNA